jgi:integrase
MPKFKHGSGSVYKRKKTWWIDYYANGKRVRESADTTDKTEARKKLQTRLGQIAEGKFIGPAADRVTFAEMAEDFLNDYRTTGKKSLDVAERRVKKHLKRFFAGKTAHGITTADVRAFIVARQEEGAALGEINLELAALKRMFNLALQAEKIYRKPYIPSLRLDNARRGFFEGWEFERLLAKLPEELRGPMSFAYWTGWRKSEVLSLTWPQVDFEVGTVRLEPGTTKNREGRLIYMTADLRALLEQHWRAHEAAYSDCPFVFHRNGKRIKDIRGSWDRACTEAGLSGRIPHDFRRTAVRNMVRAGIPERVAMMMAGHKTRSVFDRYHIVSEGDLKEAAERLNQAVSAANGHNFSHNVLSELRTNLLSA